MFKSKEEVRKYIYNLLIGEKVCLFPCKGHIPNFVGVEESIRNIFELDEFKKSKRIFISPDTPQRKILDYIDLNEREIYIASPRLRNGMLRIKNKGKNLKEILINSEKVNIPFVDIAIIGSVAVDLNGNRIGKGGGYGDREISMLKSINKDLIVITNVHELQILNDLSYLMKDYDQKVDIIVTNKKVYRINKL